MLSSCNNNRSFGRSTTLQDFIWFCVKSLLKILVLQSTKNNIFASKNFYKFFLCLDLISVIFNILKLFTNKSLIILKGFKHYVFMKTSYVVLVSYKTVWQSNFVIQTLFYIVFREQPPTYVIPSRTTFRIDPPSC